MTTTTDPRTLAGVAFPDPGIFTIDPSHSEIGFAARHVVVAKTRGRFTDFEGAITVAEAAADSSVEVSIATTSVSSGDEQRDEHLRSADFLDVDRHPRMTFRSTAVRLSDPQAFEVDGDLTILGVTRPVTLAASYEGFASDPWGGERLGISARTEIDREEWGLTWNQVLEAGGLLVGKKVTIQIDVEAVRVD